VSGIVFAFVVLITSLVLVAIVAWVARRLVGLPVGALRALIAGLLGYVAALGFGALLRAAQPGHPAAFVTVAIGVPLIAAMIFIVVAEVLVPSGTAPQPVGVVRGTRRALGRTRRYSQITRIAVQHGLGPYLRGRRLNSGDPAGGRAALASSLRSAWRPRSKSAPSGRARSARSAWPAVSPPPCGRNSTSGWRPATWP
jgi:ubiquinone biosynthesis protein